jgi:tetratricopeptide (TPR) repeat protein
MSTESPAPNHVVVLIHGIRTQAPWSEMVADILAQQCGVEVIPLRYGYFDLFRFLSPLLTRRRPVTRILRELRDVQRLYPQSQISVIAHSFGTYALCQALAETDIRLERLVLCGSIVSQEFRWDKHTAQINARVLNDCGTHDIWPVLASAVTWGYGPTGTFGFGTARVRDRFHKFTHSAYFNAPFVTDNWVPYIRDGTIHSTEWERQRPTPPWWQSLLTVLPLRWVIVLLLLALPLRILAWPEYRAGQALNDGLRHLNTGAYAQARRAYQQALAQSWFGRRAARLGLERASVYDTPDGEFRPLEVKQRIDRILAQHPDDPHAHLFLGDLHAIQDDYTTASTYYERAIVRDPTLAHGYFSLGVVYDKLGKIEQSLAMYECAATLAYWYQPYLNNLAYQYLQHQDYGKALTTYERALRLDGQFLLTYFDLANYFRLRGQPQQALRHLEKGVTLLNDPKVAALEKNQGPWYFHHGADLLHLDTLPRKQCYAYHSLTAMRRLLQRTAEGAQKRCALDSVDARDIQEWVEAENHHIGSAR